jgi:hypothetical protein
MEPADPNADRTIEQPNAGMEHHGVRSTVLAVALLLVSSLAALSLSERTAPERQEQPVAVRAEATSFFVAPDGRPDTNGSIDEPWDLATALSHPDVVAPGSTIWLRGGTYEGAFRSRLEGTEAAPIVVRQYPGERATIDRASLGDDSTFTIRGSHTWYWGFEVTNSHPRRATDTPGSHPDDLLRGDGVAVYGHHTKLINMVVHDNADGIAFWTPAVESEVYGTVTFNNGWIAPDRAHGHGLYIQNETGIKRIVDVISFNNFTTGMKGYAQGGRAEGMHFEGVVSFNNGSPTSREGSDRYTNLFIGTTSRPADRITIKDTFLYHQPGIVPDLDANLALGYTAGSNGSVSVTNSYIAGGTKAMRLADWDEAIVSGNTFYVTGPEGVTYRLVDVRAPASAMSAYDWHDNRYFFEGASKPFKSGSSTLDFDGWRGTMSREASSVFAEGSPSELRVFVRPNRFEPGRAHIIVYNWKGDSTLEVDVEGLVAEGERYEVHDVQDYYGPPVLRGVYDGAPLELPLSSRAVAGPIGHDFTPSSTAPLFAVFVLTTGDARPAGSP